METDSVFGLPSSQTLGTSFPKSCFYVSFSFNSLTFYKKLKLESRNCILKCHQADNPGTLHLQIWISQVCHRSLVETRNTDHQPLTWGIQVAATFQLAKSQWIHFHVNVEIIQWIYLVSRLWPHHLPHENTKHSTEGWMLGWGWGSWNAVWIAPVAASDSTAFRWAMCGSRLSEQACRLCSISVHIMSQRTSFQS